MNGYYFDSSALIKTLIRTPNAQPARDFLKDKAVEGSHFWSSELLVTEVARYGIRENDPVVLEYALKLRENSPFTIVPIDSSIIDRAAVFTPYIKSLDAIHLCTMLKYGGKSTVVTYDQKMIEVAQTHGIETISP